MNYFVKILFIFWFCNVESILSLSREKLKESGKLMKKTCMPKNNVTDEQVRDIDKGQFLTDRNFKCYIACVYKMGGTIKNNRLNFEAAAKQVDLLFPEELKEPTKRAMFKCKDIGTKYDDICEASFHVAKCIYETDPPNFFFP